MIPEAAVEAIHGAICDESLEDHLDPDWPGRCVKALEAAAPFMLAELAESRDGDLFRFTWAQREWLRSGNK